MSRSIVRCKELLDGRAGFRLAGQWGHVAVLEGGGHICELVSNKQPGLNPLFRPPWKTIEPYRYKWPLHRRAYVIEDGELVGQWEVTARDRVLGI